MLRCWLDVYFPALTYCCVISLGVIKFVSKKCFSRSETELLDAVAKFLSRC